MIKAGLSLIVLSLILSGMAQQAPAPEGQTGKGKLKWEVTSIKDSFTEETVTLFTLAGSYLQGPKTAAADSVPRFVLKCKSAEHPPYFGTANPKKASKTATGYFNGKLLSAFVVMPGMIVNGNPPSSLDQFIGPTVNVEYRRDGLAPQETITSRSTDFSSLEVSHNLTEMLYGGKVFVEEGNASYQQQTKSLLLRVQEHLGGLVVMQFQLPDSTDVTRACGLTYHRSVNK